MARPVAADAEATRRRILFAAASLFSEKGSAATSMRQIARAASVSQSTVHHYFGTKDGLYHACIEAMYRELSALEQRVLTELTTASSMRAALDAGIRQAWRFACEHRPAVRLMTRSVLELGETQHPERAQHLFPFIEQGAALLSAMSPLPAESLRFALYSVTFMAVRLVLVESAELARVLGLPEDTETHVVDVLAEDHLIELVARMIALPSV